MSSPRSVPPDDPAADDLRVERDAFDVDREGFDLFRAACLLPRVEGQAVDVQACVEQVEGLGAQVRIAGEDPARRRAALLALLFDELGFTGAEEDPDAPRHSFIPDVLRRRRGLPIALSVIVCAVADAAGVPAFGVGLPRRFVVGLGTRTSFVLIDPFARGAEMEADDIRAVTGLPPEEVVVESVTATTPRSILLRMLVNLHGAYLRRQDPAPLEAVLSRMLLLEPKNPGLRLQRAQVRFGRAEFAGALEDAEAVVRLVPREDALARGAHELLRRLEDGARYRN